MEFCTDQKSLVDELTSSEFTGEELTTANWHEDEVAGA